MKISFMGGQKTGIIGLLTILSLKHEVIGAVGCDDEIKKIFTLFHIPHYENIKDDVFGILTRHSDILLCVHGREILTPGLLASPKKGCYNVHPYLYAYKGKDPVGRAIKDGVRKASVGFHRMTNEVDNGEVICEMFQEVVLSNHDGVYNQLYPLYVETIVSGLRILGEEMCKKESVVDKWFSMNPEERWNFTHAEEKND